MNDIEFSNHTRQVNLEKLKTHKFDVLVLPAVPKLPHKIGEKISVEDMYNYDVCTVLANITEIPAVSIPAGEVNKIPLGLQLLGRLGDDINLLKIAAEFEK